MAEGGRAPIPLPRVRRATFVASASADGLTVFSCMKMNQEPAPCRSSLVLWSLLAGRRFETRLVEETSNRGARAELRAADGLREVFCERAHE